MNKRGAFSPVSHLAAAGGGQTVQNQDAAWSAFSMTELGKTQKRQEQQLQKLLQQQNQGGGYGGPPPARGRGRGRDAEAFQKPQNGP